MERRRFALGPAACCRTFRLNSPGRTGTEIDAANRLQQSKCAYRHHVTGILGNFEAHFYMAPLAQVIDFIGADIGEQAG